MYSELQVSVVKTRESAFRNILEKFKLNTVNQALSVYKILYIYNDFGLFIIRVININFLIILFLKAEGTWLSGNKLQSSSLVPYNLGFIHLYVYGLLLLDLSNIDMEMK